MWDKIKKEIQERKDSVREEGFMPSVYIIRAMADEAHNYFTKHSIPKADFVMTSPPYNTNMSYLDVPFDFSEIRIVDGKPTGKAYSIKDNYDVKEYVDYHANFIKFRLGMMLNKGANIIYNMMSGIGRTEFEPLSALLVAETYRYFADYSAMKFRGFKIWNKQHVSCRDIAVGSIYNKPSWTDQFEFLLSWRYTNEDRNKQKGNRPTSTFKWFMNRSILTIQPETRKIKVHKGGHKHPSPYPQELVDPFILYYVRKGEVVLDPFAGTGTTGLAAVEQGCHAILIDASKTYCEYMIERFENLDYPVHVVSYGL